MGIQMIQIISGYYSSPDEMEDNEARLKAWLHNIPLGIPILIISPMERPAWLPAYVEWQDQKHNLGHATYHTDDAKNPINGWHAVVLIGLLNCYHRNADMLFIEQDVVMLGDTWFADVITEALTNGKPWTCGEGPWPGALEQSLVFVKRDFCLTLCAELLSFKESDTQVIPEHKWHQVSSRHPVALWSFQYGRKRPVVLERILEGSTCYLQHGALSQEVIDYIDNKHPGILLPRNKKEQTT